MHSEKIRETGGVRCLTFDNLTGQGIIHGFTLRSGGVSTAPYDTFNLGFHVGDSPQHVLENRRRLAEALGYHPEHVVAGEQVHKTAVSVVDADMRGRGHASSGDAVAATDGLVCMEPGIVLMAHSADCTILFFHDPVLHCIGLAHAGWRGAVADMSRAMVETMHGLGCLRENIRVALSPSVGPCCYQIGEPVIEKIAPGLRGKVISVRDGNSFLDLAGLQRLQLMQAGIPGQNITRSAYCTNCRDDLFFSYRASGGQTGRMAGVISLLK
ncbi:MAG: peptidoglycan editing factor PgeF [Bacillota bacterium]|nr:peptidoglycan editing factor PgeF [Bacillota bacterium]MDW7684002.1 peptidoglycan editing factor PgeF [Bacillota bacterium]